MDTGQIILGFLMSGPKTGYRIKQITGKLMTSYNLSLNQIYPALRKLETSGHVAKEIVFQTGKPNRHLYSITRKGERYFRQGMTAPLSPFDYQLDFLVRAFYFRFLDRKEMLGLFEMEISSLDEQLDDLSVAWESVEEHGDENDRFIHTTIQTLLEALKTQYAQELERRRTA